LIPERLSQLHHFFSGQFNFLLRKIVAIYGIGIILAEIIHPILLHGFIHVQYYFDELWIAYGKIRRIGCGIGIYDGWSYNRSVFLSFYHRGIVVAGNK
jgi:hypothetical protein